MKTITIILFMIMTSISLSGNSQNHSYSIASNSILITQGKNSINTNFEFDTPLMYEKVKSSAKKIIDCLKSCLSDTKTNLVEILAHNKIYLTSRNNDISNKISTSNNNYIDVNNGGKDINILIKFRKLEFRFDMINGGEHIHFKLCCD